jgi:hypothetical protein
MIWLITKFLPTKDNLQLDQTMVFAFKTIMSLLKLAFTKSKKPTHYSQIFGTFSFWYLI